ncbi:MAG: carbamoyl-phosphate synthase large subunit [Oscillospiraceae bacterium]|nr:carbamoyl-phosphate synthase large subunit [Oscillospiraceae bacterium]
MPKFENIKKILVIGSGPILIGQAAEFDYSGTQGCLVLKEFGYEVILVNSNPATIMTDPHVADKIYIEPLTIEYVAKIIRKERPDALLPTLGGQTAINLAVKLSEKNILKECSCKIIGVDISSIELAEDRSKFKQMCLEIGEPCIESDIASNFEEAEKIVSKLGFPVVFRPAFTLGGTGGGMANNKEDLKEFFDLALHASPMNQVLIEKSVSGFKEIEYEVIRDSNDTALVICNMENVNPVGVHTGDSIVVCPSQTLTNREYQMLRNSALKIIRKLKINGGCNVQFALDPYSEKYYVIEVNPRVSRSSALASKASGYPIAKVSALVAIGLNLDEIKLVNTPASFEPALDYIITKIPRFPFDKFSDAKKNLNTQMKSTGEVMAFGRKFEESLLKAIRSLELNINHIWLPKLKHLSNRKLFEKIKIPSDELIFEIAELLRRESDVRTINEITKIDLFFINKIKNIILMENKIKENVNNLEVLSEAKKNGFSDEAIANLWKSKIPENDFDSDKILKLRRKNKIIPVYKMIDTCSGEFESYVPYFYSTYNGTENESKTFNKNSDESKSIIILGSGPIRIGQGIEFDYSTVHAVRAIQEAGYKAIVINNNPETVSTDYSISDKLYFEPLCIEDIISIIDLEKPKGVILTLGGQTPMNFAQKLEKLNVKIIGTSVSSIETAENRGLFSEILNKLKIPQPQGELVQNLSQALGTALRIGYPVLVRPSFVLGGRAMRVVCNENELKEYFEEAKIAGSGSVLVDKYISGKELEVDAICDGKNIFCPGIIEHIEKTGVHSGDSISVFPTFSIDEQTKNTVLDYTRKIGIEIGIKGPFNIQFIVENSDIDPKIYVIEVNPRSSRTVPFLTKATGINLAEIATKVQVSSENILENYIKNYSKKFNKNNIYFVKSPVFSLSKILGAETYLSPEMKSTGEVLGHDADLSRALYKSLEGSGFCMKNYGTVLITVALKDRLSVLPIAEKFYNLGFIIAATPGTSEFLEQNGIKTQCFEKISQGSNKIIEKLKSNEITYVVNTSSLVEGAKDGFLIRRCAVENHVGIFTSLDTAAVLVKVLENVTLQVKVM